MMLNASVQGIPTTVARLKVLPELALARGDAALDDGADPVVEQWQDDAPYVSGRYHDSIHKEPAENHSVQVVSDTPYSRRLELGFSGTDSLGRVYHQPPKNYALHALTASKDAAVAKIAAGLAAALGGGL